MRKSFYLSSLLFFCFFLNNFTAKATFVNPGVPVITANPRDTAVCNGSITWFSVVANDTANGDTMSIHYMWEVSTDGGSTWDTVHNIAPYSSAATDTLRITTSYSMNGNMYMCGAWNDSGIVWSSPATLTVDTAYAGAVSSGSAALCIGSSVTFNSSMAGGSWSVSSTAIGVINAGSGQFTADSFGIDTVIYTLSNTCGTSHSIQNLEVDSQLNNLPIMGPSATCVGNSVTLTNGHNAIPGLYETANWSATNGVAMVSSTGIVYGVSYGLDTIHFDFGNSCGIVDTTYTVQVDTVLAHGTISGPSQVCVGSWINLTETVSGGIWLSSNTAIANADFSGNVTGISQGVVVISYYLSNGCGTSAAKDTITVFSGAAEITGNDSVGIGSTNALYDATVGGTWSTTAATITVNGTSGVVTGVSAGSAEVTYTVTNICGTTYATMVIYSGNPSAGTIHGADSVCLGFTITLSDNTTGGSWTTSNDTIATVSSTGVVTGLAHGVAHITYTITNGFGTATAVTAVFVNKAPHDSIVVPGIFSLGGSYTLFGYPAAGGTWSSSNHTVGNFIGSPGFFVIYGSGTDTITFSAHNTCGTTDTSFVINIPYIAGVNQVANAASELNVYPNPSTGEFMINLVSGITEPAVVRITNIVGEKVKEFTMSTNQASALKLDQPDGIYFLTATSSTGKYSAKITITK